VQPVAAPMPIAPTTSNISAQPSTTASIPTPISVSSAPVPSSLPHSSPVELVAWPETRPAPKSSAVDSGSRSDSAPPSHSPSLSSVHSRLSSLSVNSLSPDGDARDVRDESDGETELEEFEAESEEGEQEQEQEQQESEQESSVMIDENLLIAAAAKARRKAGREKEILDLSSSDEVERQIQREIQKTAATKPAQHSSVPSQSKIRVAVRKRPINAKEVNRGELDVCGVDYPSNRVIIHEPKEKFDLTKYVENHEFVFDQVFDERASNEEIYQSICKPLVEFCLKKGRASCFAYGQTGSGVSGYININHSLYHNEYSHLYS
jgi:hypothetical protein